MEYEGEYLNGKRWIGKLYDKKGYLRFDGEFLNGQIWNGKAKEYYQFGKLFFDGNYIKGIKNGKGKEYYYNGNFRLKGNI